jgi:hypothetical protein
MSEKYAHHTSFSAGTQIMSLIRRPDYQLMDRFVALDEEQFFGTIFVF